MNVRLTVTAACLAALATAPGCATESSAARSSHPSEAEQALEGNWETGCFNKSKTRIVYHHLRLEGTYTVFADAGCTTALSVNTWTGHSTGGEPAALAGARKLDVHFDSYESKPLVDGAAAYANQNRYCGLDTWKAGQAQSVLGRECYGFSIPKQGVNLDLFQVEGDTLRFGKGSKITATPVEEDRPRALNDAWVFKKA